MKIIYYITDHGLGHSSRSVALIRELKKYSYVIVRSQDKYSFLKKSLPQIKIIHGATDFIPVMDKKNKMNLDVKNTKKNISKWNNNLERIIHKESKLIKKESPDIIISDVSIMPIMVAKKCGIKSCVISNFVWTETLPLNKKQHKLFNQAYNYADLIIKLPFGSPIRFKNAIELGLLSREITKDKSTIKKELGIDITKKLVIISTGNMKHNINSNSKKIKVLDLSNYSSVKNNYILIEAQNLINAADLVICKCGYGFVSDCLSTKTKFLYILESKHKEANYIHKNLIKIGLKNKITINELTKMRIDQELINEIHSIKIKNENRKIAKKIINFGKN